MTVTPASHVYASGSRPSAAEAARAPRETRNLGLADKRPVDRGPWGAPVGDGSLSTRARKRLLSRRTPHHETTHAVGIDWEQSSASGELIVDAVRFLPG